MRMPAMPKTRGICSERRVGTGSWAPVGEVVREGREAEPYKIARGR